jgi:hypothetical protein
MKVSAFEPPRDFFSVPLEVILLTLNSLLQAEGI